MSQQSVVLFSAKVTLSYSLYLVHNNSTNGNQIGKEMIHNATALSFLTILSSLTHT